MSDRPNATGGWQPISTAPTNTGPKLGVVAGKVRLIAWGHSSHTKWLGWCLADQGMEDFDVCEPSHWMPLPMPPSGAGA